MRLAVTRLRFRLLLRHLVASKRPIILGPFFSELGFELLYWLPWLNQVRADYNLPKSRLIALARGGTAALYDTAGQADVYDHLPIDQVRLHQFARAQQGSTKQFSLEPWETHLIGLASHSLGLSRPLVLHPSWMYRLLSPYWTDKMDVKQLARQMNPLALPILPLPPGLQLPDKFVAVRLYARATFEPQDGVMLFLKQQLAQLAKKTPLVFLNSGHRFDDHADLLLPFGDNMADLLKYMTPQNNLAVQLAVLQRAQAFIGTYGGLAQAALRCQVPALALYTTWGGTAFAHVDLTHRLSLATGVSFTLAAPQALERWSELWPSVMKSTPVS